MGRVIGYVTTSKYITDDSMQEKNILEVYPEAIIHHGFLYETWDRLYCTPSRFVKIYHKGDTLVIDSIVNLDISSDEAAEKYKLLVEKGVSIVFLKESYINTSVYDFNIFSLVGHTEELIDIMLKSFDKYLLEFASKQVKLVHELYQTNLQLEWIKRV